MYFFSMQGKLNTKTDVQIHSGFVNCTLIQGIYMISIKKMYTVTG